jgi:hypothetical protein
MIRARKVTDVSQTAKAKRGKRKNIVVFSLLHNE